MKTHIIFLKDGSRIITFAYNSKVIYQREGERIRMFGHNGKKYAKVGLSEIAKRKIINEIMEQSKGRTL